MVCDGTCGLEGRVWDGSQTGASVVPDCNEPQMTDKVKKKSQSLDLIIALEGDETESKVVTLTFGYCTI